jgi:hypothetical protein
MSTGIQLWILSLVIGVVAFLLNLVKKTAVRIDETAADIWTQGKLTANNTIHIPLFLTKTNQVAGKILKSAVAIVGGSKAITQHIEGCPGCPHCILQNSKN